MTVERELKLHVLKESRQAVEAMVNTAGAEHIHLRAFYFDTHDRELARAGVALRLRQEPEGWIQTIKLAGEDALSKIELNHLRPEPTLDLSVYIASPAEAVFKQLNSALITRFETDIHRTLRLQETAHGLIELAYDTGFIRSGMLALPVCELEFELKAGQPAAIFDLANDWQQQHQFILDFRSKAERGDALATELNKQLSTSQVEHSDLKQIYRNLKLWQAWQIDDFNSNYSDKAAHLLQQQCQKHLEQVARNAAVIAGIERTEMQIDLDFDLSEHIHYLASALHQLRDACTALSKKDATDNATEELINALGSYAQTLSTLEVTTPSESATAQKKATELAASTEFQQCLLNTLAWLILST